MNEHNKRQIIERFMSELDFEDLFIEWYWKQFNKPEESYMGTYYPAEISPDWDRDAAQQLAYEAESACEAAFDRSTY